MSIEVAEILVEGMLTAAVLLGFAYVIGKHIGG